MSCDVGEVMESLENEHPCKIVLVTERLLLLERVSGLILTGPPAEL